jgi:hypothetical protein
VDRNGGEHGGEQDAFKRMMDVTGLHCLQLLVVAGYAG